MTTLQEALGTIASALPAYIDFVPSREYLAVVHAALAQQGEPAANIPHTLAGFIGAFESETGHPPTKQEIWNGAIRSFRDLNAAAPAPQAQEPAQQKAMPFVPWSKEAEMMESWAAPQPAQDVPETNCGNIKRELTDDEILSIAHRKATRYTHAVASGQVTYGFSVLHLLDFARAIEAAIREVK